MDLTRWNDGTDAELEELVGGDLELLDLGRRVRAARPEPRVDPEFQRRLRAQLMTAAETELRPRGLGRLLRPRARIFAYGAAGLGTAMAAAAGFAYYAPHSDHVSFVEGVAKINGLPSVSPDQVITISFNQPMDRGAVVRGLTIQPATKLTPAWNGNTLVLTPDHNLQPNTPYVVTIPRNAARDIRGDVAGKDITITFGTSPVTPNPTGKPVGPVGLTGHDAGAVGDGSVLGFAGDGSLLAGAGLLGPAGGTTPGAGGTDSPAPALVHYGSDGATRVGDAVTQIALSPAGHNLATLSAAGVVAVSDMDGTHRSVLSTAADPASPLAWGGDGSSRLFFVTTGGQLTSVDLEHHVRTITALHLDPGQTVLRIAPGGRYVFVGPAPTSSPAAPPLAAPPAAPVLPGGLLPGVLGSAGSGAAPPSNSDASTDAVPQAGSTPGRIVDLGTGQQSPAAAPLQGLAAGVPSFSGDGTRVAWIDSSTSQPVIDVQTFGGATAHVPVTGLGGGDTPAAVTLDPAGERVAYAVVHPDGSADLRLVRVTDGVLLATGTVHQPSNLVFSSDGGELGYLRHSGSQAVADVATVPGGSNLGSAVPVLASKAIDSLVTAEVAGGRDALSPLVGSSLLDSLLAQLPAGLSRGYVISAAPSPSGDAVIAQIRLLRDPTSDHPTASFTDQKVTLEHAGDTYIVSASEIPQPLHPEPIGPQVVHVDTTRLPLLTTVRIQFDSDLDPSSLLQSGVISLDGAPSSLATPVPTYDATSRTMIVTFVGRLRQPFSLTVHEGLRDINGVGLAQLFTTTVSPSP